MLHSPITDLDISLHLSGQAALQADGLASAYAGPFSLSVESGECLVIRGPSGVGKSLLLRMISDLDENTGTVTLFGQNRDNIRAPDWRRQVIYQAAEPAWWEATAGEHFSGDQQEKVRALLPLLGLQESHLTIDVMRMSTGERQRMALIRSLAMHPKVLLLDEPTASLDMESTLAVEALLKTQLTSGLALVLVTHSAEQGDRMANRQMLLTRTPKP
jgi:ABC-type iron transport system FetAB ATPase subunit